MFALTSLQCQLAESDGGLGGSVAYLCCGEGEFPITRFAEILRLRSGMYPSAAAVQFLEGLHIEKYHTVEDLLDSLVSICLKIINDTEIFFVSIKEKENSDAV